MKKILNSLGFVLVGSWVGVGLGMTLSSAASAAHIQSELPSNARLQDVATITNTRDDSTAVLSVALEPDTDNVLGVYSVYSMNDGTGTVIRDLMTVKEIESPDGAVLHEEDGLKIFILQGKLDTAKGTASLEIRYLANGIKRSYESCRINAKRSPQGTWSLFNAYDGKVVTEARAHTWTLGIRTIENVCPN
jgi:hypothetical protein